MTKLRPRLLAFFLSLFLAVPAVAQKGAPARDTAGSAVSTRWPSIGWTAVADSDAAELTRIYLRQDSIAQTCPPEWIKETSLSWREARHPLLETLLPDTRWFVVDVDRGYYQLIGVGLCVSRALRVHRFYRNGEANLLLRAAPLSFDGSSNRDVARVAVLFFLLYESAARLESSQPAMRVYARAEDFLPATRKWKSGTERIAMDESDSSLQRARQMADSANRARDLRDSIESIALSVAIPEVEFEAMRDEPFDPDTAGLIHLRVSCAVDGRQRVFLVSFKDGQLTSLVENGRKVMVYDPVRAR